MPYQQVPKFKCPRCSKQRTERYVGPERDGKPGKVDTYCAVCSRAASAAKRETNRATKEAEPKAKKESKKQPAKAAAKPRGSKVKVTAVPPEQVDAEVARRKAKRDDEVVVVQVPEEAPEEPVAV